MDHDLTREAMRADILCRRATAILMLARASCLIAGTTIIGMWLLR